MKYPVPEILYEDNHLLAVNKPARVLVQGDQTGDLPLNEKIKQWIKEKYNKPGNVFLGVLHRIDRPVSGVVLFCKTSKALSRMNELLRQRKVGRKYLAIVSAMPPEPEGTLLHFLKRNRKENRSDAYDNEVPGGKRSELNYKLIANAGEHFLLEVTLHTGRHHQIRSQLSAIGCPISGDVKYGSPEGNKDLFIYLHAHSIEFIHPVQKKGKKIIADVPDTGHWNRFISHI